MTLTHLRLSGDDLDFQTLAQVARVPDSQLSITDDAWARMAHSRDVLDTLIARGETIYGVNTNMGGMARWLLPDNARQQVQRNLIHAVSTNVGPCFEDSLVRGAMLARLNALARGNSAVSRAVVEQLLAMFNAGITPCVSSLGSLGTSGDLGPLAAIAQVTIGSGHARLNGETLSGAEALRRAGLSPVELSYKDGLALINGTSFMCSVMSHTLDQASTLLDNYIAVSALTFGCLQGKKTPIAPVTQRFKHHLGQQEIARRLYSLLNEMPGVVDDEHVSQTLHKERLDTPEQGSQQVEDHYSLRCTPQVLGPLHDELGNIERHLNNELNSASDNPLIDTEHDQIYHCGHFHGQYLAMCADHLKLALSTLANLAERRIDRLLDRRKNEVLPTFLAEKDLGLRLGMMGAQFMSTSVTAELRCDASPMSNQTLPTTADFQDVVSMGLVAARQAMASVDKCAYVLGCELFLGCHAADMMGLAALPAPVARLHECLRDVHPFLDEDRDLTAELETSHHVMLTAG